MKATIAIITCRRPYGLRRLLDALVLQIQPPDTTLNIIVVDNACEQTTVDIVAEINSTSKIPVHYYEEPEPGIVAARNKCVEQFLATDSAFLLFIDDDEWPESYHWAQAMLVAQQKYHADVMISHVISIGEAGTPEWATQLLYGKNKWIEGQKVSIFYTNNLLLSRHVLEVVTPAFDSRFAMTGSSDIHFSIKCMRNGFVAYYTNTPVIEEFPKSRATVKWFIKRGFRSGLGYTRSHLYVDNYMKSIPFCLFMAGTRLVRSLVYFIIGMVSFNKLKLVDSAFRFSSFVGSLAGFFGIQYHEYKTIHGR